MKKRLFVLAVFSFIACHVSAGTDDNAVITAVVDGDTVDIEFTGVVPNGCETKERVRLIGVNTPELFKDVPEYYAREARDYTNQFWKARVKIEFDDVSAPRDKYGRLLAYIYIVEAKHKLLNEELIRNGYGVYYDAFAFNAGYMRRFEAAQKYAQKHNLGLWQTREIEETRKREATRPKPKKAKEKEGKIYYLPRF